MPSKINELHEERQNLIAQMKAHTTEHFTEESGWDAPENESKWDAMNDDIDLKQRTIQEEQKQAVANRIASLDRENVERSKPVSHIPSGKMVPASTPRTKTLALNAWFRSRFGRNDDITPEMQDACRIENINLRGDLILPTMDTRGVRALQQVARKTHSNRLLSAMNDLNVGTDGDGGYTVENDTLVNALEVNMLAYGTMRQTSEFIQTNSGEPLLWPTTDNTSNASRIVGEATDVSTGADPTFAQVAWGAFKFVAGPLLVSYELIEDSIFNMPVILGQMLGEQHGRGSNTKFTVGAGTTEPVGIVPASTLGVTATTAGGLTILDTELIDLQHSVDPAYRMGAGWLMHDSIYAYVRKMKDGEGNFLWESDFKAGGPDRLLGYPVHINQDMEGTLGTGVIAMLFGQLSKYKIRRVNGARIYTLNELYRETDQTGFLFLMREDGNLLDAGTAPVKHLITAAA